MYQRQYYQFLQQVLLWFWVKSYLWNNKMDLYRRRFKQIWGRIALFFTNLVEDNVIIDVQCSICFASAVNFEKAILDIVSYMIYMLSIQVMLFEVGKVFSSPFRRDLRPSFNIYFDSTSGKHFLYKDFGNVHYAGDCFRFVEQLQGITHKHESIKSNIQ